MEKGGETLEELYQNLNSVISNSETDYKTVIRTIKKLLVVYLKKGENLLNSIDIQEISKQKEL